MLERYDLDSHGRGDGAPGAPQIAILTLNRPEKLNPLDWDTVTTLRRRLSDLSCDDQIRVIAITGAGRAFSAGGDLSAYIELQSDPVAYPQFLRDFHGMIRDIAALPQPCIALVNGIALAGGLELMLACDLAFAADSATVGDGHHTYGQMGGGGVLTLLARMIGPMKARDMLLSGRILSADEALQWGLVSRVVSDNELKSEALDVAARIAEYSPLSISNAKAVASRTIWSSLGANEALDFEFEATLRYCLTSNDSVEGLRAFRDRRKPNFRGV